MRPISLRMRAFSCYAAEQKIDFSHLGESAIFLIHGTTGSGKSTILDAICYALYGRTSAERRNIKEIRSQHVDPTARTGVVFDFALGRNVYRVERSLEREAPKRRGAGMLEVPSSAVLYKLPGKNGADVQPHVLASGLKKVDQAVEEILGLSFDHFLQLIVIPQGQFRRFLSADFREKKEIFEKLFQSERYRRIEEALKSQSKEMDQAVSSLKERKAAILAQEDVPDCSVLKANSTANELRLSTLSSEAKERSKALQSAQAEENKGKDVIRRLDELETSKRELEKLKLKQDDFEQLRKQAIRARSAREIEPFFLAKTKASARFEAAKENLAAADTNLQSAMGALCAAEADALGLLELKKSLQSLSEKSASLELQKNIWREKQSEHAALKETLVELNQKLELLHARREETLSLLHDNEIKLEQQRLMWEGSQAAKLAALLESGKPCPVCGSTEHPSPAKPGTGQISYAALEGFDAQVHKLRQTLQSVEKEEARLQETAKFQEAAAARLASELNTLNRIASDYEKTKKDKDNLSQDIARIESTLQKAKEQLGRLQTIQAAKRENLEADTREMESSAEAFSSALSKMSFVDADDFISAQASQEQLDSLEREIKRHDAALAAANDRFSRAEAQALLLERPDIASLETHRKSLEDECASLLSEKGALQERIQRMQNSLRSLEKIDAELLEIETQWAISKELADLACGNNPFRLSFPSYCLSAFLDDVLISATERLRIMSEGRYELQRSAESSDRRLQSGLDIHVFDSYTGQARSSSTLSGGEAFLASLSLALGLADVVQSYSGGIRLDTIFIDEGFGSLDPEALDHALKALMNIRNTGRLVGIISHVSELLDRIDLRLETKNARCGSTARWINLNR